MYGMNFNPKIFTDIKMPAKYISFKLFNCKRRKDEKEI